MRLAVYTDYAYHRVRGEIYAERAFAIFVGRLTDAFERLVLIGRLHPGGEAARYPVGQGVELVELPYYERLSRPLAAMPALARSLARFWRELPEVDCVWLLGPHPLAIAFALLAKARSKRVVLGVRENTPEYVRSRHPRRPDLHAAAALLDRTFRMLAATSPVVVVGPELHRRYRRAKCLLEISVSLVDEADLVAPAAALTARRYDGELRILTVGRLETEKNPLLLADVLALLNARDVRWRLAVCGEGPQRDRLEERLARLGQAGSTELLGYVPFGGRLTKLYRESHALLHVSWTEGLPQVLLEAFAAGLPVVATDVGGIREAVGEAALLVPPGDPEAAANALRAIALEPGLRERLVGAGHDYVAARTGGAEARRLANFLQRA